MVGSGLRMQIVEPHALGPCTTIKKSSPSAAMLFLKLFSSSIEDRGLRLAATALRGAAAAGSRLGGRTDQWLASASGAPATEDPLEPRALACVGLGRATVIRHPHDQTLYVYTATYSTNQSDPFEMGHSGFGIPRAVGHLVGHLWVTCGSLIVGHSLP